MASNFAAVTGETNILHHAPMDSLDYWLYSIGLALVIAVVAFAG
jgi:hypothetical protein